MIKNTLIPQKNDTGEEEVPRCRAPPLQKVFWKGVNFFSSDTLFS